MLVCEMAIVKTHSSQQLSLHPMVNPVCTYDDDSSLSFTRQPSQVHEHMLLSSVSEISHD